MRRVVALVSVLFAVRTWENGAIRDRVKLPAPRNRPTERRFNRYGQDLAASPSWLALIGVRSSGFRPPYTFSLWSGPAAGPLTPRSVMRASPSAPTLRRVATRAAGDVRLAGGRVVFTREREDLADELVIVSLAGGRPRSLIRSPPLGSSISDFDFDGTRLTWSEYDGGPADTGRIHLVDVP